MRGQILTLLNMDQIEKKWKNWKEKKLYEFLPILKDQENFVTSFEKGLLYLKDNIKNELAYILLFPEIYRFKIIFQPLENLPAYTFLIRV